MANDPKDPVYEKWAHAQQSDRPKDYPVFKVPSTEDYVKAWCLRNNLVNDATGLVLLPVAEKPKRPRGKTPKCQCGKPCAYYGVVGGYSVKCEECNAMNAARQRAGRARKKA